MSGLRQAPGGFLARSLSSAFSRTCQVCSELPTCRRLSDHLGVARPATSVPLTSSHVTRRAHMMVSIEDAAGEHVAEPKKLKPSPESKANILSQLTFAWPTKLFTLAKTRPLQQEDLWELPTGDQAAQIGERWAQAWTSAEAARRAKKNLKPTDMLGKADREAVFTGAVRKFLGFKFFVVAPLVKLLNSTLQFTFPVLLSGVLSFVEGSPPYGFLPVTAASGYSLASALFVAMLCKAITENTYFFLCMRGVSSCAPRSRSACSASRSASASARQQRTRRNGQPHADRCDEARDVLHAVPCDGWLIPDHRLSDHPGAADGVAGGAWCDRDGLLGPGADQDCWSHAKRSGRLQATRTSVSSRSTR